MYRFLVLLLLIASNNLWAAASKDIRAAHSIGQLITKQDTFLPGSHIDVGLLVKLDKDWHTYWRNPGDSGAAPILNYTLPDGFQISKIKYAIPERIIFPPLVTFGYHGEVLFASQIKIPASYHKDNLKISVEAEWLVCQEECIPALASFNIDLAKSADQSLVLSNEAKYFDTFDSQTPNNIDDLKAYLKPGSDGYQINIITDQPLSWIAEDFFPDAEQFVSFEKPIFQAVSANELSFTVKSTQQANLQRLSGLLTMKEPESGQLKAVELVAKLDRQPSSSSTQPISWSLKYLWFAILGGLLLNLMPCVFPVISIKILSLLKQRSLAPIEVRLQAIVYTLGVIVSFVALAGLIVILRESGSAVGWGFQLQSPYFLSLLTILFVVIAANFWGGFEMILPGSSMGHSLTQKQGLLGSFFTGALAVVAASPCTAPFMGAAIGVAFSLPYVYLLIVFTGLGFGMGLPFLIFAIAPQLTRFMPKPGKWMTTFRSLMAYPILLTAIWFIWLLGQVAGDMSIAAVLTTLVGLAACLRAFRAAEFGSGKRKLIAILALIISLLGSYAARYTQEDVRSTRKTSPAHKDEIAWIDFSPEKLAELRAVDQPVFIDFTADWCLTCKVNEKVTFSQKRVIDEIKARKIKMIKADWTRKDENITKILKQYNRAGVPLYLLWKNKQQRQATVLPEVLTPDIFLKYLKDIPTTSSQGE